MDDDVEERDKDVNEAKQILLLLKAHSRFYDLKGPVGT